MSKPLHLKLRHGDEIVAMSPLSHGTLGADRFIVITKMGFFYDVEHGLGSSAIDEIWTKRDAD